MLSLPSLSASAADHDLVCDHELKLYERNTIQIFIVYVSIELFDGNNLPKFRVHSRCFVLLYFSPGYLFQSKNSSNSSLIDEVNEIIQAAKAISGIKKINVCFDCSNETCITALCGGSLTNEDFAFLLRWIRFNWSWKSCRQWNPSFLQLILFNQQPVTIVTCKKSAHLAVGCKKASGEDRNRLCKFYFFPSSAGLLSFVVRENRNSWIIYGWNDASLTAKRLRVCVVWLKFEAFRAATKVLFRFKTS